MDTNSAKKFAQAMVQQEGIANVVVLLGTIDGSTPEPEKKITSIASLHAFEFHEDGINLRRVSGIGAGKMKSDLIPLPCRTKFLYTIVNEHQLAQGKPIKSTRQPYQVPGDIGNASQQKEAEDEAEGNFEIADSKGVFTCPNSPCKCEYIRFSNLQKHLAGGICKVNLRQHSQMDELKEMYIAAYGMTVVEDYHKSGQLLVAVKHMDSLKQPKIDPFLPRLEIDIFKIDEPIQSQFQIGFALPFKREFTRFTENLDDYLSSLFEAGIGSKKKANPIEVEEEMRRVCFQDGGRRFTEEEWLTEAQIKSYFSKLAASHKRGDYKRKHPETMELKFIMNPHVLDPVLEDLECIEDASNHLEAVEDEFVQDEIFASVTNEEELEEDKHPIKV